MDPLEQDTVRSIDTGLSNCPLTLTSEAHHNCILFQHTVNKISYIIFSLVSWVKVMKKHCPYSLLHFIVTKPRWTLEFPEWKGKTKSNTINLCVSMKIYSGPYRLSAAIWGKKCQRCISWHPQRTMFTKSFDLFRTSVCERSCCQMAKNFLTLTAHPVPYPPSSNCHLTSEKKAANIALQ